MYGYPNRVSPPTEGVDSLLGKLVIKQLHHVAEHLEICAQWNFDEWGKDFGFTYNSALERIRQDAFSLGGEAAVVAFWDKAPIGTGLLERTGAEQHPELSPWLSGLYVEPGYRGKGIANEVVKVIEALAIDAGYADIYLHTSTAETLYARLGWQTIAHFEREVTGHHAVMRKALI